MNHVFKIIWNTVNQCWIAVSELSKSVGKSSQIDKRKALNVIIGAAVLAGVSTTAMAETNVVSMIREISLVVLVRALLVELVQQEILLF